MNWPCSWLILSHFESQAYLCLSHFPSSRPAILMNCTVAIPYTDYVTLYQAAVIPASTSASLVNLEVSAYQEDGVLLLTPSDAPGLSLSSLPSYSSEWPPPPDPSMQVASASPDWGVVISTAQRNLVSYMNTNFTFRSDFTLLYNNSFAPPPPPPPPAAGGGGRGGQTSGSVPGSPPEGEGGGRCFIFFGSAAQIISLSPSLQEPAPAHHPSLPKPSLGLWLAALSGA